MDQQIPTPDSISTSPTPPPQNISVPKSSRSKVLYWVLFSVIAFGALIGFAVVKGFQKIESRIFTNDPLDKEVYTGKGNLAVIEVIGEISDAKETVAQIQELSEKEKIKAVVIRIDSPGGTVAASQEIFQAVKKLAKNKSVVCSLGDLAASGGMYIALGCPKIVSNPGTLTGSIGVIMQFVNMKGLLTWAKIDAQVLKAGQYKDIGSPLRPMNTDETQLMNGVLANVHEQFQAAVAEARKMSLEEVKKFADGRIFSGEQAKAIGLVDEIGSETDAVELAAKDAGLGKDYKVVRPKKHRDPWEFFMHEESKSWVKEIRNEFPALKALQLKPGVMYLLPPAFVSGG